MMHFNLRRLAAIYRDQHAHSGVSLESLYLHPPVHTPHSLLLLAQNSLMSTAAWPVLSMAATLSGP